MISKHKIEFFSVLMAIGFGISSWTYLSYGAYTTEISAFYGVGASELVFLSYGTQSFLACLYLVLVYGIIFRCYDSKLGPIHYLVTNFRENVLSGGVILIGFGIIIAFF